MKHLLTPYAATLAWALGAWGSALHAQEAAAVVGEATLVIGMATLSGADGATRPVERGAAVRVGDRIETQAGGHVHLRFVDGGRLSVRPASRLQIENYSHSREQPHTGAIKFRLDEGVVRSITGEWGEAARERFRLNTPVAAIGVKGTDFVVRSDADKTAASVYTGAITLTPLANGCAQTLGPCINGKEALLSDQMKGQMIQLNGHQALPTLVPSVDLLSRTGVRGSSSMIVAELGSVSRTEGISDRPGLTSSNANSPKALAPEAIAVTAVGIRPVENISESRTKETTEQAIPTAPPTVQSINAGQDPANTHLNLNSGTGTPGVVVGTNSQTGKATVRELTWVRSSWTPAIEGDSFAIAFDEAVARGLDRVVSSLHFVLYRSPNAGGNSLLVSADAQANFRLAASSAHLVPSNGRTAEAVTVNGGSLFVDFSRATFATQLGLSGARFGNESIAASGKVSNTGVLQPTQSNAALVGALTLDGREAGYTFEKLIGIGALRGVTLWGR